MEDARNIFRYLPINANEAEYLQFLWEAFESNYSNGKYQFGYIAYHMLFMCFVYYKIAKIYSIDSENTKRLMIFTGKVQNHIDHHEQRIENGQESILSPLRFSEENERTIMGLFLAIGCDRSEIKKLKSIVDNRNEIAHSNGNIFYRNKENLDSKIIDLLECIELIQSKTGPGMERAYKQFLLDSSDLENRQYLDDESQIREIFVNRNYLSLVDIGNAIKFNVDVLKDEVNFSAIKNLAETLRNNYPEE